MFIPNKIMLALIPLITIAGSANAESDSNNEPSPANIERISVTASPFQSRVLDSAAAISILDGEEKRRYQSLSLGGSLEHLSGVSNISTGGQSGKPVMRGLSGDRVRILIDGVPQDHQQFGVRHPPNVDPFFAERIEVVKGPMSVLYGADAMGGVVNLVSKALPANYGLNGLHTASLSTEYKSNNNLRNLHFDIDAGFGNWGVSSAFGSAKAGSFRTPTVATGAAEDSTTNPLFAGTIPYTDFQIADAAFGLGYANDDLEASVRYIFWRNEQNNLQQNGLPTGQLLENENLIADINYLINPHWQLSSVLSWQQNRRDAGNGVRYQDLNSDTLDLSLQLDRYQWRLSAGHFTHNDWQGQFGVEWVEKEQRTKAGNLLPNSDYSSASAFLFEHYRLGDFIAEIGLRYDHIEQDTVLQSGERDIRSWNALSGSAGLTWQFADNLLTTAHVARGFRAPSVFDLYANGVHGGVAAFQRGNAELAEEYSLNKDIGVRYFSHRTNAAIVVFHSDISDYIYQANTQTVHEPSGLPIYALQQGDASIEGVELDWQMQVNDNLMLTANYTRIRSNLKALNSDLPMLPADNLYAALRWQLNDYARWQDNALHISVTSNSSKNAAGAYEPFAQYDRLPFGTASTPGYSLWNVGYSTTLYAQSTPVTVDLSVDNLFNKAHRNFLDTYKGYALGMGRSMNIKLTIPFSRR